MPIATGTALAIGGLAAGGSIAGGALAKKGADAQARAAEQSSAQAIAEQRRQYDTTRADMMPWLNAGRDSLTQLQNLVGVGTPQNADYGSLARNFTMSDFEKDPAYDFRLSEGQKALERSAAARGTLLSGGTLKELTRYGQGYASNEFNRAFDRFEVNRSNRFNQLASLAGAGQTTASRLGDYGAQNAANIGDLIVGGQTTAAAARASGYNALGGGVAGAAGNLSNLLLLRQLADGGSVNHDAIVGGNLPLTRHPNYTNFYWR